MIGVIVMKLVKHMRLYYVNKFTLDLERAAVDEVFDGGFSVFFNIGSRRCHVKLKNNAIGTRLYASHEQAVQAQRAAYRAAHPAPDKVEAPKASLPSQPAPDASSPKKPSAPRDVILECAECGRKFIFTVGEQEFYKKKRLSPPRTCSFECRERRKAEFEEKEAQKALRETMTPSVPYRTGSVQRPVRVTGGVVNEISDLVYLRNLLDSIDAT
jgi:hypothetical protein